MLTYHAAPSLRYISSLQLKVKTNMKILATVLVTSLLNYVHGSSSIVVTNLARSNPNAIATRKNFYSQFPIVIIIPYFLMMGYDNLEANKHPICEGVPIVKVGILMLLRHQLETVVSPRLHQQ